VEQGLARKLIKVNIT